MVARIDPAGDGTPRAIDHEREADQRTIAPLLLGVAPFGQLIAPTDALEVGIAHVVEEHRLGLSGKDLALFHQTLLDELFGLPKTVGQGIERILPQGRK